MGHVLPFPADRSTKEPPAEGEERGRVLLFLGVRYERMTECPGPQPGKGRRRKSGN